MLTTMHTHTTFAFVFFMNCYWFDGNLDMKMDDLFVYVNMMTPYLYSY